MRVLVITPMYPSPKNPAFGVFIQRQVEALKELGVEVVLATSSISRPRHKLVRKYGELAWQTIQRAREGFDVVHVHFPTIAGMCGLLAASARRTPMVVTLHGGEVDDLYLRDLSVWKRWVTKATALWSAQKADAIIAVGSDVANVIVREGVPEHKIRVVDMGVDCRIFRPRAKKEARCELGVSIRGPLIVFVGWLIPIKGPEYFIHAAALLKGQYPGCRWCLVGGGSDERLRVLAEDLGVSDRVMFVGQRTAQEVALWLSAADVMVMPSLTEPFGLAGLEAIACGTPIVASDVGGLRSFVNDGLNGFLVPPGSSEAIVLRVQALLGDAELRERMGRKGVETAQQHDLRLQARRVLGIYEQVIQRCVRKK